MDTPGLTVSPTVGVTVGDGPGRRGSRDRVHLHREGCLTRLRGEGGPTP